MQKEVRVHGDSIEKGAVASVIPGAARHLTLDCKPDGVLAPHEGQGQPHPRSQIHGLVLGGDGRHQLLEAHQEHSSVRLLGLGGESPGVYKNDPWTLLDAVAPVDLLPETPELVEVVCYDRNVHQRGRVQIYAVAVGVLH